MASAKEIPRYHELMWPTLRALQDLGGSETNREIADKVIEIENLTEEQQAVMQKRGQYTLIEYRLLWVRSVLKRVGAVESSQRGVWSITERGRSLGPESMADVRTEYKKLLDLDKAKRPAEPPDQAHEEDDAEGPPSGTEDHDWKTALLGKVMTMPPDAFERLSSRLLREAGFTDMRVTGKSGDGGIDGTGVYRLSLVSFPIYFQSKKWSKGVGSKEVRDFRGAMAGRGDRGLLITTASFTAEAKKEATRDGAPPVDLIDGSSLCDLLKRFALGVRAKERVVEDVEVDESFFDGL